MTDPTPEDVERVALLPCPFCGADAKPIFDGPTKQQVQYAISWGEDFPQGYWRVQCVRCGAFWGETSKEVEAVAGWNSRAAMPPAADHSALIRELRDALDSILTGGNHLALNLIDKLGADFAKAMPPEMNSEVAQEEIDDPAVFNIWVCWQRIMLARAALRKANEALGEKA